MFLYDPAKSITLQLDKSEGPEETLVCGKC